MIKLLVLSLLVIAAYSLVDQSGYTAFYRTTSGVVWAHKVVRVAKHWGEAQKHCKAEGAALTGFDSYEEAEFVFNMTALDKSSGYFLGARRRQGCRYPAKDRNHPCSRQNMYQWKENVASQPITDEMWTTGINGEMNPAIPPNEQECLSLRAPRPIWMDMSKGGYLDDVECGRELFFICGKPATVN